VTPIVNAVRLSGELETLAGFSDSTPPAITRVVFTPPDMSARQWLKDLCAQACLALRVDAVGNMFARWDGAERRAPAIATGSHIDAIPGSGRYDGTVGVLGGLEAIRALQESGFQPQRAIELMLFTSEEPTRFGIGCLGSRLLAGALSPEAAANLRDNGGASLDQVRRAAGFDGELREVRLPDGHYHAFIELHIEQGPRLEQQGVSIGIVMDIAAPASLRVIIQGQGGHAGAVLMKDRHDALLGACEIALAVEHTALGTGAADSVATSGVCEVFPGAVNSIPSSVRLELDVRDTDLTRRDAMVASIQASCKKIADERGLEVTTELLNADAPGRCDANVVDVITHACETSLKSFVRLVSRAYHDSLFMSRIVPTGMIFIPCRGGISHRPDEYASPEDIEAGVIVLAHTLAQLASQ
jgi:N-carbamoyl-L-amino-acid hydrolase